MADKVEVAGVPAAQVSNLIAEALVKMASHGSVPAASAVLRLAEKAEAAELQRQKLETQVAREKAKLERELLALETQRSQAAAISQGVSTPIPDGISQGFAATSSTEVATLFGTTPSQVRQWCKAGAPREKGRPTGKRGRPGWLYDPIAIGRWLIASGKLSTGAFVELFGAPPPSQTVADSRPAEPAPPRPAITLEVRDGDDLATQKTKVAIRKTMAELQRLALCRRGQELDLQEREGLLLKRADVVAENVAKFTAIRLAFLALPGKIAAELVEMQAAEAEAVLSREIRSILQDLSER